MAFLLGSFVGSFLNVVIYRVPREKSVNEPKRSFCPSCEKQIPWFRNIPIITWILQGGKCAECKSRIAFRYVFVEVLTAVLFLACWQVFPPAVAIFAMAFCAFLIVIAYIDAEFMFIFPKMTYIGALIGIIGALVAPVLVSLAVDVPESLWTVFLRAIFGFILGFLGLWAVVLLGKKAFGKRKMEFDDPVEWHFREPRTDEEDLCLIVEDDETAWHDMFVRPTDELIIKGPELRVSGELIETEEAIISKSGIEADGRKWKIEDITSLEGKAVSMVIPREAMGMGDPPLFGMIGAFLGWQSLLFVLFASCMGAIIGGLFARVGFGKHMPYGPYLAFGALVWMFGGWKLWYWYISVAM